MPPADSALAPDLSWLAPDAQSAVLAALLAHGGDFLEAVSDAGERLYISPPGRKALALDGAGQDWLACWADPEAMAAALAAAYKGETVKLAGAVRHLDGGSLAFDLTLVPLGTTAPVLVLSRDVGSLKQAEERCRLLLIEMQHRVKNTLAVVQAVAMQTLRRMSDPAAAGEVLAGRIGALASAQDLLQPARWSDCMLEAVATRAIEPYESGRFSLSGPDLLLSPRAGIALWMALHELCTNAVKFGALANATGRIDIDWSVDAATQRLAMRWREQGGPPCAPPGPTGFGTRLIRDALAAEFGGNVALDYAADGLAVTITGKLARVTPRPDGS